MCIGTFGKFMAGALGVLLGPYMPLPGSGGFNRSDYKRVYGPGILPDIYLMGAGEALFDEMYNDYIKEHGYPPSELLQYFMALLAAGIGNIQVYIDYLEGMPAVYRNLPIVQEILDWLRGLHD